MFMVSTFVWCSGPIAARMKIAAPGAAADAGFPISPRSGYRFPPMSMICGRWLTRIGTIRQPRPSCTENRPAGAPRGSRARGPAQPGAAC